MPVPAVSPHAALKHELLVRYLDAWMPAALHGHKKVAFVCAAPALLPLAQRVFAEFDDLLHGRTLTVVGPGEDWTPALGLTFGVFDGPSPLLAPVASSKGGSVLAFGASLVDTPYQCRAELVTRDGSVETLFFGAATLKALEKFKDELWALDEYAGCQLRDPGDPTLLDISIQPNVGPLRRLLSAHLRSAGSCSLEALRAWTVAETVYRATDATRAVQASLSSGELSRSPVSGRLTPTSLIALV